MKKTAKIRSLSYIRKDDKWDSLPSWAVTAGDWGIKLGSPKKGDSPHGVGNVAKRQKRLPCKGSWLWAMRTDWGIKKPKYFLFKIYFLRKSLRVALTRPTSILREARRREKWTVKKQNQKPTAFEIAYLVIEAIIAISTLITAIKWW